jgi:predicted GNAT family acetyltransferase
MVGKTPAMDVLSTTDPAVALSCAERMLAADPVRTNVVGTLLRQRIDSGDAGRYWVARPDDPLGVAIQSPLDFMATHTPMPVEAVEAIVDTIVEQGVVLPGVNGEAGTAAAFAGAWTERTRSGATPVMGQRLYEVVEVRQPPDVPGALRPAREDERQLLVDWLGWFAEDTGERVDPEAVVERRLPLGQLWVWEDGQAVSMAALTEPVAGVSRVQGVYTPRHRRGRGYASATVASLSARAVGEGVRCVLHTDLQNPTSNAIYRAIGYRAVAEVLRYRFETRRAVRD